MSIAHSPQDFWPGIRTVREIDDLLRERWLLDFQPDADAIKKLFPDIDDALRRFEDTEQKAVTKAGPQGTIDERQLFRLLAHPGVFAHKAVTRRHYLLDGIAFAIGLLRLYQIQGAVLDVGCHIGTSTDTIARLVSNKVVGIDPVGVAIEAARRLTADLPNIEFHRAMLPWQIPSKYGLVLCHDVLHHVPTLRQPTLIQSLGSLVEDNGLLIISGPSLVEPEWLAVARPALLDAGLGYVDSEVFGGYGGNPPRFLATQTAVLRKGDTSPLPDDLAPLGAREWESHFKDFANSPGIPLREKTQAFERARRTRQALDLAPTNPFSS